MSSAIAARKASEAVRSDRAGDGGVGDQRFRALLAEGDWAALPAAVRRRFSKRPGDGSTVVYVGKVLEARMSRAGWLLAQALRLIGGPLPPPARTACPRWCR